MYLKSFTNVRVIIIILVLIGAAGYFVFIKISTPTLKGETIDWKVYINTDVGYSILYPSTWIVDESGLQHSLNKEVIISPPSAEPFTNYVSILVDQRPLELIRKVYSENKDHVFYEKNIIFAGQNALMYTTSPPNFVDIYISYKKVNYLVSTHKYDLEIIKQSFASFQFIE